MKRILPWFPDWVGAGLVAGLGWAIWAVVANYPAGMPPAIKAGATQFILSFIVASSLTTICARMFSLTAIKTIDISLAITAPLIFQFSFQYGLHYLAGTPYIIKTITPVMCVGLIWVSFYTRRLAKQQRECVSTNGINTSNVLRTKRSEEAMNQ